MALSNYLENKLIDFLFRGVSYSPPSNLYVALCNAVPTAATTGSTLAEVSGGNYTRKPVVASASTWYTTQHDTGSVSTGTSGLTGNVNAINWQSVTWSDTVVAVAVCDALTAGNLLYFVSIDDVFVGSGANVTFSNYTLKFSFA